MKKFDINVLLKRERSGDVRVFVRVDDDPWVERGKLPAEAERAEVLLFDIKVESQGKEAS